ncbi:YhcN/YlaJ family sporulation lipoprotein [Paenibacillus sp. HWE-109]|uniref:YhcN/YlaJ family sporulation lipoprotein n=1 Tax=Paenibacillus sp. HWE-109 TaxID=1306526 RepID=UPI001EDDDCF4|nr:YhcN/YlaJ family sporulation lipoprotein [Paenibacillus sp. HWE-109]UKS28255.1 YhcN/YlaJ family sporulation lipoprotein [Paenibacillus sp. HWE-109]
MKKQIILTASLASVILIVGCSSNKLHQQSTNIQNKTIQQETKTDNRIQIADQAVTNIMKLNQIQQANVLVTNRNAYVAAMLHHGVELSRNLEDQIAAQVKAVDPAIQNVYVSTNPDFFGRINTYVQDVRQGKPVAGFFDEFSETIKRVFPSAR